MAKKFRILAAADLHGSVDIAKKLSEKAKKGKVDLVILAGDINGATEGDERILLPFMKANQKVAFIPGNWDFDKESLALKAHGKNIDNYYISYGDIGIAGIGNANWKTNLKYEDFELLRANFKRMKPKKRILVSHVHAKGTMAEFSGFPGDKILRKAVEEFKPDLLISAHIHEAEGIEDKIGNTRIIQVGRNGTIIEV
ncbi:MAG: metallophosphoesterase [Candidatus Pacearchaeota archaeon]